MASLTVNAPGASLDGAEQGAQTVQRTELQGWQPHGSSAAAASASLRAFADAPPRPLAPSAGAASAPHAASGGSAPLLAVSALPAEAVRRFDALLAGEELPDQRPPRPLGSALAAALAAGNGADDASPRAKLRRAAETFARTPSLFKRRKPMPQPLETHGSGLDLLALAQEAHLDAEPSTAGIMVDGWKNDPTYGKYRALKSSLGAQAPSRATAAPSRDRSRASGSSPGARFPALTSPVATPSRFTGSPASATPGETAAAAAAAAAARQSVHKVSGRKGVAGARTYTSRYRGVHQTFPTRRWEAQFRRAGKPTSLGCFDREEEAARAYDKMMLWAEIHQADMRTLGLLRNGVTNFPASHYEADVPALRAMTQDELVQELRRVGREQATAKEAHANRRSGGERPAKHGSAGKAAPAAAGVAALAAVAAASPDADAATGNGSASSAEAGASPQRLSSRSPRA